MFSLRRKIGTGATSRRRPARECQVGIESLDTRAVPAIVVATPGSPLIESGLGTLGQNVLNVSWDEHGHAVARTTTINPFTGLTTSTSTLLANNLDATGKPMVIPGVTGDDPARPLTLAYRLPTPVQDGDVVVRSFQSSQISDLLRFQTVSDPVAGTRGYLLVYSEPTVEPGETPTPADTSPIPTPASSVLTQSTFEFGVQGFDIVEYQAEQATYSGLSDGNAATFGPETQ